MRKKTKIILCVCSICLAVTACKPVTSITEEDKKSYEELVASIDIDAETLEVQLSDMVYVDAAVTPGSKYKNGLGIYEFEREVLDLDTKGFIDRMNQYFGREEVFYEDSIEYLLQQNNFNIENQKVGCSAGPHGSHASYECDPKISKEYLNLIVYLLADRYLVSFGQPEVISGQVERLAELFQDQYQNLASQNYRYIIINGEEDYNQIEEIYKRINIDSNGRQKEGSDYTFSLTLYVGGSVAEERRACLGAVCYESIGETGLPLLELGRASYKNSAQKKIPDTSYESNNEEVRVPVDNKLSAAFDGSGKLQDIIIRKSVRVNEFPERTEQVIDLRQVINIIYEKVKSVKRPVNIYSIQLFYTGIVVEDEEGLEDYIHPVWEVCYYDSHSGSPVIIYLNAVTGKELIE